MNNHSSAYNPSSNSFNSNTFSSNGLKSRSKKHSEDYSLKSDLKQTHYDARDLQTYSMKFLPDNNLESNSKLLSSSNYSQKQLTKKVLERIESEQNHLTILEDEKIKDNEENANDTKSLTEIEEDILNTISNKHTSNPGRDDDEVSSLSKSFEERKSDRVLKKNVTFSKKISRAKTYDLNIEENQKNNNSKKSHENLSINNSSNEEIKKQTKSPERIYDILRNKKEEKGANKIFKNIAVMMLVNHFVRQIKLKSGHFGILGNRQLKILNDLCNPHNGGLLGKNQDQEHANILVRLIRKNQLIQKTLKKSNFIKRWTEIVISVINKRILSKIKVIMPNHKFKFTLNCFVLLFSISEFGFIPLNTTFMISDDNLYAKIRAILILILLFDILLNFNTGYFHRGTLILNRKEILKRYIRLDFWVESLSLLPSLILNFIKDDQINQYKPQINFIEFLFLIRIIYLDKMIRKICDFYQSTEFLNNFISLLKLGVWSLYVAHICACMFHYVSFIDMEDYQKTWISNFELVSEDTSVYSEYITSLYWSVTTMVTVGYGDIIPLTPQERIVAITSMLGACCVFAYIMNSIGGIINSFNNRQTVLRQKIQAVNKYLDMKNIDNDLRIRIRKYLEYLYEEKNAMMKEGHSVVSNLSASLKTEIFQRLNGEIIVNIPVLINNFSLKLLSSLTLIMNEISFTPEDFIFDENIIDEQELFFIYEGEVELYIQNTTGFREDTHLKKIKKGEFFGEISFFTGQERSASAISLDFSTLIGIKRCDFINVIKNSSYDYEKLCMIRDNIMLYRNYNNMSIRCFCCNYTNHIAKDCPMVHVIINPQRVIRDHIKIEPTMRRNFPRFQKKFKALKNLEVMIHACIKLHRTTTLEMSTITVEQDENDDEDDDEPEQPESPKKSLSPFRKFGSSNLSNKTRSFSNIRSKSSIKNNQEENTPYDDREKLLKDQKYMRRERNMTQNTLLSTNNFNQGSLITGFSGAFETYLNNMNQINENPDRISSTFLTMKKRMNSNTQTTIPKTPAKREGSMSPKKKTQNNLTEIGGKYVEHQKMVAEALMLQGISTTGPQENFVKLSYNELLNQFDKMKSFEIYFPYNNVEVIVESIKSIQKSMVSKKKKSRFKKRNSSSFSPQNNFYHQMSFKQIFKGESINTHNTNYEDLMYRRALTQNEGSPAKKLRLLPTKSLNFNKGITNLRKAQTLKKKISKAKCNWICYYCKKKKH